MMTDTLSRRSRTPSSRTNESSSSSSSSKECSKDRYRSSSSSPFSLMPKFRFYWNSRNKTQKNTIVFVILALIIVVVLLVGIKTEGERIIDLKQARNNKIMINQFHPNRRHDYGGRTSDTNSITTNHKMYHKYPHTATAAPLPPSPMHVDVVKKDNNYYDHNNEDEEDEEGLGICFLDMDYNKLNDDDNNNQQEKRKVKRKIRRPGSKEVGGMVGPCFNTYPKLTKPVGGWLQGIDYLNFRDTPTSKYTDRITCMDHCIDRYVIPATTTATANTNTNINTNKNKKKKQQLRHPHKRDDDKKNHAVVEADNIMLIEAAKFGLIEMTRKLMDEGNGYHLNPLYRIVEPEDFKNARSFNAIQEAIRGGYAEVVQILTKGNVDMVIDTLGRTVKDYVVLHGSPIRPRAAKNILGIDVMKNTGTGSASSSSTSRRQKQEEVIVPSSHFGWNTTTEYPYDATVCDIDIIVGEEDMVPEVYHRDYFVTGRPLVLRNQVSEMEGLNFRKDTFLNNDDTGWKDYKFKVGPTAYPSITGQEHCKSKFDIEELESKHKCSNMPEIPMVYAYHPKDDDFSEIWPELDGEIIAHPKSSFRSVKNFYGHIVDDRSDLSWQVFFGGDGSGATLHSHYAAFNMLYVGIKEWKITPPLHRGWSGMPAKDVRHKLDDDITLTCIQQPGDLFIIPNFWGHMTINHGFTIGSAGILSDYYQTNGHDNLRDPVEDTTEDEEEILEKESTLDPTEKGTDSQEREEGRNKEQEVFFVHINKTGGTSMVRMLSERCSANDVYQTDNWDDKNGVGHRTFHLTAHSHIRHYGRQRWNDAYTFAIVRHPLARQVSNFFFLAGSNNCGSPHSKCQERLIPDLDLETMSDDDKIDAFHKWIQVVYKAFPPNHAEHYRFGAAGHGNEVYSTFGATQSSWMVDPNTNNKGAIIVKDVFKLEELSDDISKLSSKVPCLGSLEKMYRKNTTAKYPHYMLFGTNKETNSIINTVFADDFRNLHYEPLQ